VRLTDNVFASAFTGLTHINYNSNPGAGISARFDALRFMLGGALTGVWRDDQWRFQPTVAGTFGSETQNAYVDSVGTSVAAQTLTYGRLSAGPEVGYAFSDADRSWTFEPFVTARLNVDFASSAVTIVNGTSVNLRPGTLAAGSMGVGAEMRFLAGFYVRGQASYDSIGVSGLDVWTGLLRGGMSF
jgi:outer membrane autotransporter protein